MDGFEVLRRLSGSNMPEIIFVTAYDEFALKAFDANALDYAKLEASLGAGKLIEFI